MDVFDFTPSFERPTQALSLVLESFADWLSGITRSPHTKRTYVTQVNKFVKYLKEIGCSTRQDLVDMQNDGRKSLLLRSYRGQLKNVTGCSASSINNALIAIDHFFDFLGIERVELKREIRSLSTGKALSAEQETHFLRAVTSQKNCRDRAIALVLYRSGLRIGECAALDISNIYIRDKNIVDIVTVNGGLMERRLDCEQTCAELSLHLRYRRQMRSSDREALWINRDGSRLSVSGIVYILRRIGWQAGIDLSAETLRRTGFASRQKFEAHDPELCERRIVSVPTEVDPTVLL